VFGDDDVRPARPRTDHGRAGTQATLIREAPAESRVVLRLPAALDIATVEAIRDSVIDAVDNARGEIVLDLEGVRFLDSYGIRLLVTVRRRAWDRDLPFRLHGGRPLIRDLLELVGQDPLYHPGEAYRSEEPDAPFR
jgi:anti-anti-sigma factor